MPTPAELDKIMQRRQQQQHASTHRRNGHGRFRLDCAVRTRDIADFTRQLATMAVARLPLLQSLQIICQQQKNARFQEMLQEIIQSLQNGKSLRDSLSQHPRAFTPLYVNAVHVGEVSGTLPDILEQLAVYLEKMNELRRKLITTLTYPAVILLVAAGALTFLLFGIMPAISDMFHEFNAPMPMPTQILLGITDFLRANMVYLLLLLFLSILGLRWYFRTATGRRLFDHLKIGVPLFGAIIRKILIARFARTLGTLLDSGVSLLEALSITATSAGNHIFQEQIHRMRIMAERGEQMESALQGSKIFPPLLVQMIAVGEETAELPGMLTKTAEFYEAEIDAALEALTSIIEPVIIVVIGVLIGGAIIAIYLQIFDLMNVVQ